MAAERSSKKGKSTRSLNQLTPDQLMKELKKAIDTNNVNKARQLLDQGADPNGTIPTQYYGVSEHIIPSIRSEEMLELFLQKGANINLPNQMGYTLLIKAVQSQNVELVIACLRNGADPNYKVPSTQFSVLRLAAMIRMSERTPHNMVTIFELLLQAGADPNEDFSILQHNSNSFDMDPLLFLIIHPDYNTKHPENALPILQLLEEHKADMSIINPLNGNNLLHAACLARPHNEAVVNYLLESVTIDIDSQNEITHNTPLINAVESLNVPLVRLLINHGASGNIVNKNGDTPLLTACAFMGPNQQRDQIVQILLSSRNNGSDTVNIENNDGHTPLILASVTNTVHLMDMLIENGADINHQNAGGETPLIVALSKGHIEASKFLLDHGANPNIVGPHGISPLQYATMHGRERLVHELLKHGADPLHESSRPKGIIASNIARVQERKNGRYPRTILPALHNETRRRVTAMGQALRSQTTNVGPNVRRHIMGFLKKNKNRNNTKKKGGHRRNI